MGIREWLDATDRFGIPADREREDMLRQGEELLGRLDVGAAIVSSLDDPPTLDIVYAAIELLDESRQAASPRDLARINQLYALVSEASFEDVLGEKDWLLSRLAVLAWNQSRLAEDYPATKLWQARCCEHVLAQDHVAAFLDIPYHSRSAELNRRYLGDVAVLLAACDRLERNRNINPHEVARDGASLFDWLESERLRCGALDESVRFLAASVAVSTFAAHQIMGHQNETRLWSKQSAERIASCLGSAPLVAVHEHVRLSTLYGGYCLREALDGIDRAIAEFERLRMADGAIRACFLKSVLLKELGQSAAALELLTKVSQRAQGAGDSFLASTGLANCAQILGSQGKFAKGIALAKEAVIQAQKSQSLGAMALAHGSVAELFRDVGNFCVALDAYASCISLYDEAGIDGLASYTRVVAAETLLLAGRPAAAVEEILAALPVIERQGLTQEGAAAVAILKESIRQQNADPVALRELREQLQQMRQHNKL